MPRPDPHDDDGDLATLTDKDRARILQEIHDLDTLLLTCRDIGLWREMTRVRRHLTEELATGRRLPIGDDTSARHDYEILPCSAEAGGGWKLRLLTDGVEVGGGVFPVMIDQGGFLPWWQGQTEMQRAQWLLRTTTGSAAEAYLIHLRDEAWHQAAQTAGEWLDSRPK
jgi:hypothetical protein